MNDYLSTLFTNKPGTGLDANGNLLAGWKYGTYSNGVGQGTPQQIGSLGLLGQTVTGNTPPAAGTYNPNIVPGPVGAGGLSFNYNTPTNNNLSNLPNLNTTPTNTGNDLSLGLPALYPRRRADQSFNRGNNYFNMSSGNYQNRFA